MVFKWAPGSTRLIAFDSDATHLAISAHHRAVAAEKQNILRQALDQHSQGF
jgi:hypothetical protein